MQTAILVALVPTTQLFAAALRVGGPLAARPQALANVATAPRRARVLVAASVVDERDAEVENFEAPDLLDDPFEGSGGEDLLATFDLDAADVGTIADWGDLDRNAVVEQRVQDRASWGRHDSDCGSPEVQIAMFTTRIKHVTKHVIENPKDHASRRGLLALVSKRRRLLHYYFAKTPAKAEKLADDLGVRFRFRNQMPGRAEKYRQYTSTKQKRKTK